MSTWTDQQFKEGGEAKAWDSSEVNWGDSLYEWDGQTASTFTDQVKH